MDFKDKKVTVMGLGLFGGGVATVNWLVKHGAKVTVTDLKTKRELKSSLNKLTGLSACKLVLGRHEEADFKNADIVVQNPGVPRESRYLKIARQAGAAIENEASLFLKNCPGAVIGVTGTRGKSTTASLIYEMLTACRLPLTTGNKRLAVGGKWLAFLAGLPQKPMLEILDKVKANDIVVLELSSWQLEILGEQKLSPRTAVITNIFPDHLNRYAGMKDYIAAKKNIFLFQKPGDFCVLNYDNEETKKMGKQVRGHRLWFSGGYFPEQNGVFAKGNKIYWRKDGQEPLICRFKDIKLAGEHNLQNVLAAVCAAGIFQVKPEAVKKVLRNFSGLPFRQELIRKINGISYVNDTTATTPDGTSAALNSIKQKSKKAKKQKTIILIAGGDTKNIPDIKYKELAGLIERNCKAVILFKGKGSRQILKFLKIKNLVSEVGYMAEAVGLAENFAEKGDTVLLSPACASFNLFVNEFDRGEQFNRAVKSLKHKNTRT